MIAKFAFFASAFVTCNASALADDADADAPALPQPEQGIYRRSFLSIGSLVITVNEGATLANITASIPGQVILEVVNSPLSYTPGAEPETATCHLDHGLLATALGPFNSALHSLMYTGTVTPDRLKVTYFPNGVSGSGDPSLFITIQTDTNGPEEFLFRGHARLQ